MEQRFSLISILLIPFFLAACSPPATPLALPSSSASEDTVVTTPVAPTPTEAPTVDPNVPPGYTRFENGIYYLDKTTENGNTLTYTWDTERKAYYRPIFSGYVRAAMTLVTPDSNAKSCNNLSYSLPRNYG